ncbi:DNA/RNA-binding protein KIN17-like [Amphiura filiformis]|uniref:DNA/RNA-binding protein KIN17-like n=1 Tax=Amphiura filiformis TaxID=82378 RepID=UPI003B2111E2
MGKNDFLTPKAIANRVKSKGLQKLRWYCQMCQKQCRDENGFKCHTMSESHQRQLLLFAENENEYLDAFSEEFFDDFMELLKRRFGGRRVHCNIVYNEYIQFRDHVHMNSTKWETLTEFVKWTGREGFCTVDHTEKGWFMTYIDRDPETLKRQEALAKKEKVDLDDEERIQKFIQKQVERASDESTNEKSVEYTEFKRDNEEEKVTIKFGKMPSSSKGTSEDGPSSSSSSSSGRDTGAKPKTLPKSSALLGSNEDKKKEGSRKKEKRKTALEEIMEEEAKKKAKIEQQHKDYWLAEGIVVKVTTKRLGEKFYKKKGVVTEVIKKYEGVIKMTDTGSKIKVDQIHVETVIPAPGKRLLVVNGPYRGCKASLVQLSEKDFAVSIKLESGPLAGKVVREIPYEDICKLAPKES